MDDGYRRGLGTRRYALGGKGIWSRELGQRVQFVRELFSRSPKPPPCPTTGSKIQTWTGEANLASQWESQALSLARIWPSGVLGLCRSSRQSEGCVSLSFRPSPQYMAMAQLEGAPRVPSISQAVATVCFLFERRLNVGWTHESTRRPLASRASARRRRRDYSDTHDLCRPGTSPATRPQVLACFVPGLNMCDPTR